MLKPFHVLPTSLDDHFAEVEALLRRIVDASVTPMLGREDIGHKLIVGLQGDSLETTARNRGRAVSIAPLIPLPDGLWAWLGYQEEWSQAPGRGPRRLFFRSSSITVYFGFKGVEPKPQMFRAEWAGAEWRDDDYRFQGGNAGHPHWQFDAMESMFRAEQAEEAAELAAIIRAEATGGTLREFTPTAVDAVDVRKLVSVRKLDAMHFASSAGWWRKQAYEHAHLPQNVTEIRAWLKRTLSYVLQELQRV